MVLRGMPVPGRGMKPSGSLLCRFTGLNNSQISNSPVKLYTLGLIINDQINSCKRVSQALKLGCAVNGNKSVAGVMCLAFCRIVKLAQL